MSPSMTALHAVLITPSLSFSGRTERTLAAARVLLDQGVRVSLLAAPGSQTWSAREAGCEVHIAELPASVLRAPFAYDRTRKLLASLRPDLLHASDVSLAPIVARFAARLGVPYILDIHRQVDERVPLDPRRFALALVSSRTLIERVVNRGGVPRGKIRLVPHAPAPVPNAGAGPFASNGRPLVGCTGYLDGGHATEWFLEAARLVARERDDTLFAVLGEGPLEAHLRRRVRELGLASRLTLSVPTTAQAAQTLSTLDIHVSCRLDGGPDWLSCQALAQGVPAVLAAQGEAFELVEDGRSGVLVPPGEPRRLAEVILRLLADPEHARRLGEEGRRRIAERAAPEVFAVGVAEAHAVALGIALSEAV